LWVSKSFMIMWNNRGIIFDGPCLQMFVCKWLISKIAGKNDYSIVIIFSEWFGDATGIVPLNLGEVGPKSTLLGQKKPAKDRWRHLAKLAGARISCCTVVRLFVCSLVCSSVASLSPAMRIAACRPHLLVNFGLFVDDRIRSCPWKNFTRNFSRRPTFLCVLLWFHS